MKAPSFTSEQIIERLEILWRKLEDEGRYVSANTVSLAIDDIKRANDTNHDLFIAARCALGHLTGNMDGDMDLGDPIELLRASVSKVEVQ